MVWRLNRRLAGHKLLVAFAATYPEATFVQVGAGDGKTADPIREFVLRARWRGILIEPVPYVFRRLQANYRDVHRVTPVNVAIADRDGTLPVYHFREAEDPQDEQLPAWYHVLGSLSREVLERHAYVPDHTERIVATEVPCRRLGTVLDEHGIERHELIAIDTEGYDLEVLRQVDFESRRPRLLVFEHAHLSAPDRAAANALLEGHGYEVMEEYMDTWAVDVALDDELSRTWRRLEPALPPVRWAG